MGNTARVVCGKPWESTHAKATGWGKGSGEGRGGLTHPLPPAAPATGRPLSRRRHSVWAVEPLPPPQQSHHRRPTPRGSRRTSDAVAPADVAVPVDGSSGHGRRCRRCSHKDARLWRTPLGRKVVGPLATGATTRPARCGRPYRHHDPPRLHSATSAATAAVSPRRSPVRSLSVAAEGDAVCPPPTPALAAIPL